MLIYVLLFCLLVFLSFNEQYLRYSRFLEFRIFVFIVLLVFVSARPLGSDKDSISYFLSFSRVNDPLDYFINYTQWMFFDPMYYLIPSVMKTYVSDTHFVLLAFMVYALLGLSVKLLAIQRLSGFFFLSLVVYYSNFFFLHEMTQIRVGVSTAIFLFALPYLKQKRYAAYVGLILISLLFHYSSFLFFVPLFLHADSLNKKLIYAAMCLIILLTVIPTDFILPYLKIDTEDALVKSNNYIENAELGLAGGANKFNLLFLLSYVQLAFSIYFSDKIYEHNAYVYLLIKLQIFGLLLFQIFAPVSGFAFRFSEIFLCTQVVTTTYFVYLFQKRWLGYALVIVISAGYLSFNLFYSKLMGDYHINL